MTWLLVSIGTLVLVCLGVAVWLAMRPPRRDWP